MFLASPGAGQFSAAGVAVPIGAAREFCATYRRTVGAQHAELRHGETTPVGLPATAWIAIPPCTEWLQDGRPQPHAPLVQEVAANASRKIVWARLSRLPLANQYGHRCGGVEPGHVRGQPGECVPYGPKRVGDLAHGSDDGDAARASTTRVEWCELLASSLLTR